VGSGTEGMSFRQCLHGPAVQAGAASAWLTSRHTLQVTRHTPDAIRKSGIEQFGLASWSDCWNEMASGSYVKKAPSAPMQKREWTG